MCLAALGLVAGCASSGARPRPFPIPGPAPPPAAAAPSGITGDILKTALQLVGTPYRNGGADQTGFDCSGLVQFVYARHGVALPRSVDALSRAGVRVPDREVVAADLLFFSTTGPGATHVAIALGDGRFVHAPSGRGVVRVESLAGGYWPTRFLGARRVVTPRER
jgi:cell wall-associated NlpC family hydrolase